MFFENFGAKQTGSNIFVTGPGGYMKVDEKERRNSDKIAGLFKQSNLWFQRTFSES